MGTKRLTKDSLTRKEADFIKEYTNPESPGYMNGGKAAQLSCDVTTVSSARRAGHNILKRPVVQKALKDLIEETNIKTKVQEGMQKIVEGFVDRDAYRARDFTDAARFIAEVCGDKRPDQHLHVNLAPEDRDKEYEAIVELVQKKQQLREVSEETSATQEPKS